MYYFKYLFRSSVIISILLLTVMIIPTFWRMFQYGIFSMHDFHVFRLFEYDKCINDGIFPCRWAPDSTFEYGQPLFNFYGQLPYLFGELFRFIGFSVIDSTKALFISSLVLSALAMFLLSKQIWKNNFSAIISALVYTYAPYRAVDIYVRGALPESLAFMYFPLIVYFFNKFVWDRKIINLLFFSLTFAALMLTHNLSVVLFIPFFVVWALYLFIKEKAWRLLPFFFISGVLIFGLTAFYLLPVAFENNHVMLNSTTGGYYDYRNHFVTIKQLLFSRYWGYGASLWGEDDRMNLSVGQIQWILPLLGLGLILIKRSFKKYISFYILFLTGWAILWLTHNKSTLLWNNIPFLAYIQFPWRFFGTAVMSFALASGVIGLLIQTNLHKLIVASLIFVSLVALNIGFFFEDLWFKWNDQEFFSGENYKMQVSSAATDFWPKYATHVPSNFAPENPAIITGTGSARLILKNSHNAFYSVQVEKPQTEVQFPIVYFPGWQAVIADNAKEIYPKGDYGLITLKLDQGRHLVELKFENTFIRNIGNYISLTFFVAVFSQVFSQPVSY